jgi:uncharacterized membrane protein
MSLSVIKPGSPVIGGASVFCCLPCGLVVSWVSGLSSSKGSMRLIIPSHRQLQSGSISALRITVAMRSLEVHFRAVARGRTKAEL